MAWVTVRNEGESYLYTYLRSGTDTIGEYPPILLVPRVPTVTVNLPEILRENSLPVLALIQITAKMSFTGKRPTGTTELSPVPSVKIRTTGKPPVLPLEQKLAELKH
jgi:hypothetical protein